VRQAHHIEAPSETDLLLIHAEFVVHIMKAGHSPKISPVQAVSTSRRQQQRERELLMMYPMHHLSTQIQESAQREEAAKSCALSGVCSARCSFYTTEYAPDVFVCTRTGRMHHCTSASCDELEVHMENRVCRLTGYSFPLDTFIILPTHSDFVDFARRERIQGAHTEEAQPDVDTHPAVKDTMQVDDTMKKEADAMEPAKRSPKQKRADQTRKKPVRPKHPQRPSAGAAAKHGGIDNVKFNKLMKKDSLICDARNFICKLVAGIESDEAQRLAGICVTFWIKCINTKYFEGVQGRYKFKTHCAAVLYNCMEGIRVKDAWVLEREPGLYTRLPPSKKLKLFGLKPSAYTSACRFLHEMAREM
jgi:hypothetical protein